MVAETVAGFDRRLEQLTMLISGRIDRLARSLDGYDRQLRLLSPSGRMDSQRQQLDRIAVSYTHLDVYKRQALARKLNFDLLDVDSYIEDKAGCSIKQIFADKGEAVSYTHLDVYKRQEMY